MNRRRFVGWLGAAGAVLAVSPGVALAETARELSIRGQDLLAAGKIDQALTVLRRARERDPRDARVYALLGRAYFQRGDARKALPAFRLAVRLNPEDTLSRMMVETIELFPLPPVSKSGLTEHPGDLSDRRAVASAGSGRVSALERRAREERARLLATGHLGRTSGPFRLLLDPGHGGDDPGAAGPGLRESDVALDLSLRLARILAKDGGIAVSLTRVADAGLPNWARAGLAAYYDADWLISLHATRIADPKASGLLAVTFAANASTPQASAVATVENRASGGEAPDGGRGGDVVFLRAMRRAMATDVRERSRDLAARFLASLPSRGPISPRPLAAAPLRLLAETETPAMLLETGFLSNPGDAAQLASAATRGALAKELATAVLSVVGAVAGEGEEKGKDKEKAKMPPAAGRD